jgi:hypothetical protein
MPKITDQTLSISTNMEITPVLLSKLTVCNSCEKSVKNPGKLLKFFANTCFI